MLLSTADIAQVISKVSYKPGWSFTVYEDKLRLEGPHLRIRCRMENAYHPGSTVDLAIDSPIPDLLFTTDLQVVTWLMWRLSRIETHEVREWLLYDGERIFDPHDGVERT